MDKIDLLLQQIASIAGNPATPSARFRSVDLADLAKEITTLRAENERLREELYTPSKIHICQRCQRLMMNNRR